MKKDFYIFLILGIILRLIMYLIGYIINKNSNVKFEDIDYQVVYDSSLLIL